jgi:hypothetical protein
MQSDSQSRAASGTKMLQIVLAGKIVRSEGAYIIEQRTNFHLNQVVLRLAESEVYYRRRWQPSPYGNHTTAVDSRALQPCMQG